MTLPPMIMLLRIGGKGRKGFPFLLPVGLVWPFVAALFALIVPLAVVVMMIRRRNARRIMRIAAFAWQVMLILCALRGLRVQVKDPTDNVDIGIW
jgi:hypothetical protein